VSSTARDVTSTVPDSSLALRFAAPGAVKLGGVLGEALLANHHGRLANFILDEKSPAIALFAPEQVEKNVAGDWYGEHAGKWLSAASRAAARTRDAKLLTSVQRVADYLVSLQGKDGYLGTYASERRFMCRQPPKQETWDGAPSVRTWDIWTHSYLILGLLDVHRLLATPQHLEAAARIGDLCWRTLADGGLDITELGNHFGMSATVLIDPAMELYFATGERRYLDLAQLVVEQMERNPRLALVSRARAGADASEIATGKAYQLLWNLVGLAKLYRATRDVAFHEAVTALWGNIREHHLTLGGGPWGGIGHRSREVFNPAHVFSPYGYVETCSTLAWILLNRELLQLTGEATYAAEIERSAYNDLLGAQAANGEDWCYYSFPNGRRVHTTYWRCCKSSGALALEQLSDVAYAVAGGTDVRINLLGASDALLSLTSAGNVRVKQTTGYPFDESVEIHVSPERAARFAIQVRIPDWAEQASAAVNGESVPAAPFAGDYLAIEREWRAGDVIQLTLPMEPRAHFRTNRSVQDSRTPEDAPVHQEVLRQPYLAITRGPLVYATGLIDGFKTEETLRVPDEPSQAWLETLPARHDAGPDVRLHAMGRPPLTFCPYYRAGGRQDHSWRLTWMSLPPE
jgi:uncharacterized protein